MPQFAAPNARRTGWRILPFAVLALAGGWRGREAQSAEARHAIAMHGEPAWPDGFTRVPYANPAAPKGGRLVQGVLGTFDSLNPLIVKAPRRCRRSAAT